MSQEMAFLCWQPWESSRIVDNTGLGFSVILFVFFQPCPVMVFPGHFPISVVPLCIEIKNAL